MKCEYGNVGVGAIPKSDLFVPYAGVSVGILGTWGSVQIYEWLLKEKVMSERRDTCLQARRYYTLLPW